MSGLDCKLFSCVQQIGRITSLYFSNEKLPQKFIATFIAAFIAKLTNKVNCEFTSLADVIAQK